MLPIKITDRWRGSRYRQRQCGSPPRYQLTTRSSCSLYESWVANEVVRNSAQFRPTKSYFVSYRDSHQTKRKGNQPRISDLSPFCPKLVCFWFFFSLSPVSVCGPWKSRVGGVGSGLWSNQRRLFSLSLACNSGVHHTFWPLLRKGREKNEP